MDFKVVLLTFLPRNILATVEAAFLAVVVQLSEFAQRPLNGEVNDGLEDDKQVGLHDERCHLDVPIWIEIIELA